MGSSRVAKQVGLTLVNTVGDAVWYIDGNKKTLVDRSLGIPAELQHFQGYKKPEKHKHKKVAADSLQAGELRNHSVALFTLATSLYMKTDRWMSVREAVLRLAANFRQYATYLEVQNDKVKGNHSRTEVRDDTDKISIGAAKNIHPGPAARYSTLHQAVEKSGYYEPVFVNDHAPPDAKRQFDYLKRLVLPCKCVKYTYTDSRNHLHFLWKVPTNCSESDTLSQSIKVRDELKVSFPVYHSRAMRRELFTCLER